MPKPNIARVLRLGLTAGIGGAASEPLWRLTPGARSTVVTLDVEDINLGSEISDLLTERLRAPGALGSLGRPCVVGIATREAPGEGCINDGVVLAEKGVIGDGLGEKPISTPSPV